MAVAGGWRAAVSCRQPAPRARETGGAEVEGAGVGAELRVAGAGVGARLGVGTGTELEGAATKASVLGPICV